MSAGGAGAIPLETTDLLIAAALVLVPGALSVAMRLGLERRLAVASARTVAQLLLIGYVLTTVFDLRRAWMVAAVAGLMILVASRAAVKRSARTFGGAGARAFASLVGAGLLTVYVVTAVIVGRRPWWEPQYMIPLLGMILGNGLNGISLCLDHLLESLTVRRGEVELMLSLGATRWEAARGLLRESIRRGMIPILNSMSVVGLVSLPGMMTGQILAGADPLEAVKYQIVVMFMIAAATALGSMGIALLAYRALFNEKHQLRIERITKR